MAQKQYIIENGGENNRWLVRIDQDMYKQPVYHYAPDVRNAIRFANLKAALILARPFKARVWRLKNGEPVELMEDQPEPKPEAPTIAGKRRRGRPPRRCLC